jgi:glutamine amidotransferase
MIVILDYGMGNPGSILNMLRKVGGDAIISSEVSDIESASGIILPGVGSFDNGIIKLKELNIIPTLEHCVFEKKTPFLGVCLGMQLILSESEEGKELGLNWIPGVAKRFNFKSIENNLRLKVPHMGWNIVKPVVKSGLFSNCTQEERFYFVHSFAVECDLDEHILATANYGYKFTCGIQKDNIFGVQFHPEKSHRFGMNMFKNFIEMVKC